MKLKTYTEWLTESYYDGYHNEDPPTFIETYNDIVIEFEDKMNKEGIFDLINDDQTKKILKQNAKYDVFWSKLSELDKEQEFDEELGTVFTEYYDKLYYTGGYDRADGEPLVTKLYSSIRKKADDEYRSKYPKPGLGAAGDSSPKVKNSYTKWWTDHEKFINNALSRYVIDKNYDKWKKIYTSWVHYIHRNRGTAAAKKYGI